MAALAAGTNTMILPITTASIAGLGALSPTSRCQTFNASADGYGRGEGFGVLVFVTQATPASDPLALVRASGVNQDGRSSGLTAPSGPTQTALVRGVLNGGKLAPEDVGFVSVHGTGEAHLAQQHTVSI